MSRCDKCLIFLNHPMDYEIHELQHKLSELLLLFDKVDVQDRHGKILTKKEDQFIEEIRNYLKKQGFSYAHWKD